jgi:hypothetical protein
MVTFRPCRFTRLRQSPGTHWIGGWVRLRAGLDTVENKNKSCPCWDSNSGLPSRNTSMYLPFEQSRLLIARYCCYYYYYYATLDQKSACSWHSWCTDLDMRPSITESLVASVSFRGEMFREDFEREHACFFSYSSQFITPLSLAVSKLRELAGCRLTLWDLLSSVVRPAMTPCRWYTGTHMSEEPW